MIVLDLCSGLGGWSEPWLRAGHTVIRVDLNPKFAGVPFTLTANVMDYEPSGTVDVILASPPCEGLSVGRKLGIGDDERKRRYLGIANRCRQIAETHGERWVIENPRGELRKAWGPPTTTVYYCQYGESYAKPTDLWSNDPRIAALGVKCPHKSHPGRYARHSDLCLKSRSERARIPYPLASAVMSLWGREP